MEPRWLTLAMVKGLHLLSIAAAGGPAGLRDEGLLQSAIDAPRNLYLYGDDPSIQDLAARYCVGIIGNHPFIDGNKRAGILATATFLDLNDYLFHPDEAEGARIIISLAAREIDERGFAGWVSDFTIRKTSRIRHQGANVTGASERGSTSKAFTVSDTPV